MKYGTVDIGANTIRMVMYRVSEGRIEYLLNSKIIGRLIDYVEEGIMKIDGAKVLIDAINKHKELASHHALDNITYFATAPLRVDNVEEVLAAVREGTGENIDVLTGDNEAKCGVDGISYDFDISNCLCLDLGGGSTEISMVKEGKIAEAISIPMGSASITKQAISGILPTHKEIDLIKKTTLEHLKTVDWLCCESFDVAYVVGGSARAMAKMHQIFDGSTQDLHGYRIFSSDIGNIYKQILDLKIEGIKLIDQYCGGRLFSIIPGMVILQTVMEYTNIPVLRLSRFGVREGYLLNYVI